MAYGAFTERGRPPGDAELARTLGAARAAWDRLNELALTYRARGAWRFYGRNYGWAHAYKARGRALVALFPDVGVLTALVILDDEQTRRALGAGLSARVRAQVAKAEAIKEGRWLFVRVSEPGDVNDIETLMEARAARPLAPPSG